MKNLLVKSRNSSSSSGGKKSGQLLCHFVYYETYKPICQADAVPYKEKIEQNRIIEFLAKLNDKFELIRVNILIKGILPSMNKVHALAQSEESRKNVMRQYSSETHEIFALASTPMLQRGVKTTLKIPSDLVKMVKRRFHGKEDSLIRTNSIAITVGR